MNRYTLFFTFISLYAHITLSNSISQHAQIWENIQKVAENSTFMNIMRESQEEFDYVVDNPNLSLQQRNLAFVLKQTFHNAFAIKHNLRKNEITLPEIVEASALFLATMALNKAEYTYEKLIPKELYDKENQINFGQEAFVETLNKANQKIHQGLLYLVDGTLEKEVQQKIDNLSSKR